MARNVYEIMNPELFTLRPGDSIELARAGILAFGITGAPVLDEKRRPVGMISLRDLASGREGRVSDIMRAPVPMVRPEATIAEAGRVLAESGHHRLAVVDREGQTVGNVSALDVVRGLLGMPIVHPSAFPHLDKNTGLVWSDESEMDHEMLRAAPQGPGLLLLIHGGPAYPDTVVWAEATGDVRGRLEEILDDPESEPPVLARLLDGARLKFRVAACPDREERRQALVKLLATVNLGRELNLFEDPLAD